MTHPFPARSLPVLALTGLLLLAPGCASIVTPGRFRPVKVETHPAGASVFLNEAFQGRTPLTLRVDRRADHRIRLAAPGKEPYLDMIESRLNGWYAMNFFSWDIPGFLIDGFNGSMWAPKPNRFDVYLLAPGGDYDSRDQRSDAKDAWRQAERDRRDAERAARRRGAPAPAEPVRAEPARRYQPSAPSTKARPGTVDPMDIDFYGT